MQAMRFLVTGGSQGIGAAVVQAARAAGHQVVFTGRNGQPLSRRNTLRAWQNATWTALGEPCRLHDLRHTFATGLAERGVSEGTMLALMGHMSRAMLERYSHIRMCAKRHAVSGITLRPEAQNSEIVPVKVPVAIRLSLLQ